MEEEEDTSSSYVTNQTAFEFVDCSSKKRAAPPVTVTVTVPERVGRITYASFFTRTGDGSANKGGQCRLCSKRIKRINKGSVRYHIQTKHPEIIKKHFNNTKPPEDQKPTSDLYFLMLYDTKGLKYGECRLCSTRLNTTNRDIKAVVMRHLGDKHPMEYKECLGLTAEEDNITKQTSTSSCKEATYFNITIANKTKYGECRLCMKTVKMKYSNTTGLKRHLLAKHKKELRELYGQVYSDDETNKQDEVVVKTEEQSPDDTPNDLDIKSEPMDVVVKTEVADDDIIPSDVQVKIEEGYTDTQFESCSQEIDYTTTNPSPQHFKQTKQNYELYYCIMPLNEGKMAICRSCGRDIQMKNSNTTGLKRHLQNKHPEQFIELCQGNPQGKSTKKSVIASGDYLSLPSTSALPQVLANLQPVTKTMYSLHYEIVTPSDNVRCGICRLCSKCVKMTSGNTSGLKRHLKSKHPQQFFETFHPENVPSENRCLDPSQMEQQDQPVKVELFEDHFINSEEACESNDDGSENENTFDTVTCKAEDETYYNLAHYERRFKTYFSFSSNAASNSAECRLCMESISIDDSKSALRDHLMSKHPELIPEESQKEEEKSDDISSTYVVAIYSGSESDGEDENGTVTVSLRVQKKYSCYYTMSDENGVKFGICRLCTQMIKMKKSNTSGLRRHLKSRHPQEYVEITGEQAKQK